jgi:hypothetical protein
LDVQVINRLADFYFYSTMGNRVGTDPHKNHSCFTSLEIKRSRFADLRNYPAMYGPNNEHYLKAENSD